MILIEAKPAKPQPIGVKQQYVVVFPRHRLSEVRAAVEQLCDPERHDA